MTDIRILLAIAPCTSSMSVARAAGPPGRITGVGGIFFKSKDPETLMAWYRDVPGIRIESGGGAMMRYDAPGHRPC